MQKIYWRKQNASSIANKCVVRVNDILEDYKRAKESINSAKASLEVTFKEDRNAPTHMSYTHEPMEDVRKTGDTLGRQIQDIRVIGVGGAGCNTVQRMMEEGIHGALLTPIYLKEKPRQLELKLHERLNSTMAL
ncbi:MAG: hypothetical protein ACE5KT_07470 [Methanosarcinales archaeon]